MQHAAEYSPGDLPDEVTIRGRGGPTSVPGFAWLDEQTIRPGVYLYLTDLLCSSYPNAEQDFAVIWVNGGDPPSDWNREAWRERIDIAEGAPP